MVDAARKVLADAGCKLADVALLVPHQANVRIIDAVVDRLKISEDRVFVNLDRYGNTSAATIPIAYDEAVRSGMVKPGQLVLLVGFGGGFTWGSVLLKNALGG